MAQENKGFIKTKLKWVKDHLPETVIIAVLVIVGLYFFGKNLFGWNDFDPKKYYPATRACIIDSVRHYPPVVRGGKVYVTCKIANLAQGRRDEEAGFFTRLLHDRGDTCYHNHLLISEIQPANLSIEQISENPKKIVYGDTATVSFVFNTDKIVGYTQQKIRFYCNIDHDGTHPAKGMLELTFDTHVVRPAGDQSDYEDVYFEGKQDLTNIIVDGDLGEQGYTTDTDNTLRHGNKKADKGFWDKVKSVLNMRLSDL